MKLSNKPTMKTVAWVLFSLFILLHSPNVRGASICGPANNKNYITAPDGQPRRLPLADLCTDGAYDNDRNDNTYWKWDCGYANCQAYKVECGTADGNDVTSAPTGTGLCYPGATVANSLVLTGNTWNWNCKDSENAQVSCSATNIIIGECGTAAGDNKDYVSAPNANLCASGSATNVGTYRGRWRWYCQGDPNTTSNTDTCRANIVSCGDAHETYQPYQPSIYDLCNNGTRSSVSSSGNQWIWTCTDDVGTSASCWASKDSVYGDCGTSENQWFAQTPSSNLCNSGTPSAVTVDGSNWTWQCIGNSSNNPTCTAHILINGSCGTAINTPSESRPSANLCSTGDPSVPTQGTTTWDWTCSGDTTHGGTTVNCSTNRITNGDCGAANGGSYESQPSTGLCNAGTATSVVANGQYWNWTCTGVSGGSNENCTANKTTTSTNSYCAQPPFISSPVAPNIMTVIDASGSMSWNAYNRESPSGSEPVYSANEEGYYRPDKNYRYNSSAGYWEETISASVACPDNSNSPSTNSIYKGSCLNYHKMSRMDLVRWAITGGNPNSCTGINSIFHADQCDPELWQQPGNANKVGEACNDTIGGCILRATNGTKVKVPWSRVYDGLAFQFKAMSPKPRMGALFYSNSTVRSDGQVYMGDFTAPNSTSDNFPYMNLITAINSTKPDGGTPTGPAMWDTYNYFKQTDPQYGGIPAQQGSGDRWKNPMYVCDGGGANCKEIPCAKNFVLLLSDGQWNTPSCSIDDGQSDPVQPAYQMHQPFTNTGTNKTTNVNATYSIGLFLGGTGEQSLKNVAMYGSFNKSGGWPDSLTGYPSDQCNMDDCGDGKGSACTELPTSTLDWDNDAKTGVPDTFHSATNATEIKTSIKDAILDMMRRSSSGTAVSVLSSSEGSGANLLQALFYPKRTFNNNTEVSWTSDLMNYWYYLDPYFSFMQIHEDTIREGATETSPYTLLDLKKDYITTFAFDNTEEKTLAHRWDDAIGKGSIATATYKGTVPVEDSLAIWRAGFNLWWTDPAARDIFTSLNGSTKMPLTTTNSSSLDDYLGQTASSVDANSTINYVRGYDCADATGNSCVCGTTNCTKIGRNRTVTSGICSTRKSPCDSAADCPTGDTCVQESHVWKMGDIISSTPRLMGPAYLNTYHSPTPYGYNDSTYEDYIKTNDYKNRQLVFVGANDGMLHAFKLGKLIHDWTGRAWHEIAKQEGATGTGGIGSEAYAFIPKNVLPYLRYLHDKDYCHMYLNDGPTTLFDAAINKPSTCSPTSNYWDCPKVTVRTPAVSPATGYDLDLTDTSWRTTLIGSMGIGGSTCDADLPDPDRISTPLSISGTPVGWSSYFALDVTDQSNPKPLWEFSHPDLGVTNVGAGIVKAGGSDKRCSNNNAVCSADSDCGTGTPTPRCVKTMTNGRWFAVLASGSTGPIQSQEFLGRSDKTLKLFILDLKTGALLRTIDTGITDAFNTTPITNAFAGSISSSAIDLDRANKTAIGNYQDDAIYIGYVQNTTKGGVLRLVINDDINPDNWTWSKVFKDNEIGPVTSSVVNLLDRRAGKLWLYFAEGRYFYKQDDLINQRRLYGVQETCFDANTNSITSTCSELELTGLKDQTTSPIITLPSTVHGWYVNFDSAIGTLSAERVISNPTPDTLGNIYFLSFAPNADVCGYGGTTYFWALDYRTGCKVTYKMQGKALIQVSTGEIKELSLSDAFTEKENRRTEGFPGIPPTGGGMIFSNPPPIKKFMHVQEQ